MNDTQIKKLEDSSLTEVEENLSTPEGMVAFTEQRSCADLFRLCKEKQLDISPGFQRGFVWPLYKQTRFIDSLLKQLPIPSMCFCLDSSSKTRLVIDGLQRISTLNRFFEYDEEWTMSALSDVDARISGKTNRFIKDNHPEVWPTVQNVMIPVTVIHCDLGKPDNAEYINMIFHRLNTGSLPLTNQEIRNCIYSGRLNDSIKKFAKRSLVSKFFGKNTRSSNEEYLLRVVAFFEKASSYDGKMGRFLNAYMSKNRNEDKSQVLELATTCLHAIIEKWALDIRPLSRTVKEALLLGVMRNNSSIMVKTDASIQDLYMDFANNAAYSVAQLSDGLTSKKKVEERIKVATEVFSR